MTRWSDARWLISHTRTLLWPLIFSVLARIANQLLGISLLVLPIRAIAAAAADETIAVSSLVLWLVVIALAKALLRYLEHYLGHLVAFAALERLRELFFARLMLRSPVVISGRAGAELTDRATRDIDRVEVFFAHTFPPAVSAVVVPGVALVWLGTTTNVTLALVVAGFSLALLLIPLSAARATWRASRRVAATRGELAQRLGDDFQGTKEVLAFGIQPSRLQGLDRVGDQLTSARIQLSRAQAIRSCLTVLAQMATLVTVLLIGFSQDLPVAGIAVTMAVAVALWKPTQGIDDFATGLDAAFAATDRIRQVIDAPTEIPEPEGVGPTTINSVGEIVTASDVAVRYPNTERPVAQDVSLVANPGSWQVIAGASGSGKSSLALLLARGLDPVAGSVSLRGRELPSVPTDRVRKAVALVTQRPSLLTGTLGYNLRLANTTASDEELWDALKIVALDDWVAGLPGGLATKLGERSTSVSGGQLQRIALARALVARPQVLVIDEALSQLDDATATTVRARIRAEWPELSVIEVSHRVDLISNDDFVTVMDAGRVVESGPAGELRPRAGAFAALESRV